MDGHKDEECHENLEEPSVSAGAASCRLEPPWTPMGGGGSGQEEGRD